MRGGAFCGSMSIVGVEPRFWFYNKCWGRVMSLTPKLYPPQCALPSYPGVLLCLWICGTSYWKSLLFGTSQVQYCLYEYLSSGIVQSIFRRHHFAVLRWRIMAIPENIELFQFPPYTPAMNPIEQIWKEIRKRGFRNKVFATLGKVMDVSSITGRDWLIRLFN